MSESVEQAASEIRDLASAWTALLDTANTPLTTNDPWVAAALTVIAFELLERRQSRGRIQYD